MVRKWLCAKLAKRGFALALLVYTSAGLCSFSAVDTIIDLSTQPGHAG